MRISLAWGTERSFARRPTHGVGRSVCAGTLSTWSAQATLTETVKAAKDYVPLGYLPLPHPSPRNQPWLAKNLRFEKDVLPIVQTAVRSLAL